jgi:hypothetical protein
VLALPNATDPNTGKRLWEYAPPAINGDLSGVHEYAGDLDAGRTPCNVNDGPRDDPAVSAHGEIEPGVSTRRTASTS